LNLGMGFHRFRFGLGSSAATRLGLMIFALVVLALAWYWSPLADWLNVDRTVTWIRGYGERLGPITAISIFILASVMVVPLTFLAVVSMVSYGPVWGVLYLILGTTLGGIISFFLGKWLGRDFVERIAGHRIRQLDGRLANHALAAVIVLRMVPVAPFAVVNMAIGVSSIGLPDFILGTVIGMLPGTVVIGIFIDQFINAFERTGTERMSIFMLLSVLVLLGLLGLRKWVNHYDRH
jgi:phospholipase D1/2